MFKRRIWLLILMVFVLSSMIPTFVKAQEGENNPYLDIPIDKIDSGFNNQKNYSIYGYLIDYLKFEGKTLGDSLYLRLKGDWDPGNNLSFHTELSFDYKMGIMNQYAVFESYGLPVNQGDYPYTDFNQTMKIDHLWGMVNFDRLDVKFGKMPIAWGTGYVFNPTARVVSGSFLNDVAEETPGTVGLTPSYVINDSLSIQGYIAFQDKSHKNIVSLEDGKWENIPYGIKVKGIKGNFDYSLGIIKEVLFKDSAGYQRKYYLGSDFVGAVGNFGVYGEAVLNLPRNKEDTDFQFSDYNLNESVEYCVGFDYIIPDTEITTRMEYYHQGSGETNKDNYDINKLLSGESILQGEDYLFLHLENPFNDYFTFTTSSLVNLNDSSLVLIPELKYDIYNNFELSIGLQVYSGEHGSEFNGEYDFMGNTIDLTESALYIKSKLSF